MGKEERKGAAGFLIDEGDLCGELLRHTKSRKVKTLNACIDREGCWANTCTIPIIPTH